MVSANDSRNGFGLGWQALTLFFLVVGMAAASLWAILTSELTGLSQRVDVRNQGFIQALAGMRSVHDEFATRTLADITRARDTYVTKAEFKQFETNMESQLDDIKKRLVLIEQTRPTADTLNATASGTKELLLQQGGTFKDLIAQVESRVRALEATTPRFTGPPNVK